MGGTRHRARARGWSRLSWPALAFAAACGDVGRAARPPSPASAPACLPPSPPAEERPPRQVLQGGHARGIRGLAFAPDGARLATWSHDEAIKIWETKTAHLVRTLYGRGPPDAAAWVDADHLAFGGARDPLTRAWSTTVVDVGSGAVTGAVPLPAERLRIGARRDGRAPRWVVGGVRMDADLTPELAWVRGEAAEVAREGLGHALTAPGCASLPGPRTLAAARDARVVALACGTSGVLAWTLDDDGRAELVLRTSLPGRAHTVAVSPTGQRVAVAVTEGPEAERVFVLRVEPAAAPAVAATVPGTTRALAFSGDGEQLAAATDAGVVAVRSSTGQIVWRAPSYGAPAESHVAFSPSSSLLAVGDASGAVSLHDVGAGRDLGTLGAEVRAARRLALLGEGRVAAATSRGVTVWDTTRAARVSSWATAGEPIVRASGDGALLLVDRQPTTAAGCPAGRGIRVRRWDGAAEAPRGRLCGAPCDTTDGCLVHDVDASGERLLVTTAGGASRAAVLDVQTGAATWLEEAGAPLLDGALSADGAWATSGYGPPWIPAAGGHVWDASTGRRAATFRVKSGAEYPPQGIDRLALGKTLVAAAFGRRLDVTERGAEAPATTVTLPADVSTLAVREEGAQVLVGLHDGTLVVLPAKGGEPTQVATADGGPIREIAIRGEAAVTRSDDGAIRVWDLRRGVLRGTLAEFEDDEWIVTTPRGAYTGTREVADRVGWVYERPLEHFGFEQFAAAYRDPDRVARRLRGEDVDAEPAGGRPPRVAVSLAEDGRVRVRARSARVVDTVRVFVEGRPVEARRVCAREADMAIEVPRGPGKRRVTAIAFDDRGAASNAATLDVAEGPRTGARPVVWVVAIGVSRYPRLPRAMQLAVADADAHAIAGVFRDHAGPGRTYARAEITELLNEAATPEAIRAALAGLGRMAPEDVGVLFFAGHGVRADGATALATAGVDLAAQAAAPGGVITWTDLAGALGRARGRVLVLLDACHTGDVQRELVVGNEALAEALVKDGRAGAVVFAAAKGRQLSFEPDLARGLSFEQAPRLLGEAGSRHGFFTAAILRALRTDAADRDGDGELQLSELLADVTRRVSSATSHAQTPWVAHRELFGDFRIAVVGKAP